MIKLDDPSQAAEGDGQSPSVAERLERARLANQQGDFDHSARLYEDLTREHPGEARFYAMQSQALSSAGRYADAVGPAEQTLKLNPSSGQYFAAAAFIHLRLGHLKLARRRASEAVRLDQRRPAVALTAARVFREAGEHSRSSELTERTIQIAPDDHKAWYLKALLAGDLGRTDEAETALVKTLALQPSNSLALAALANLLLPGLEDEDMVTLLQAHRIGNVPGANPVPAVYALADVHHRAGSFTDAFTLYEEVNNAQAADKPFDIEAFETGVDAVIQATRSQHQPEREEHGGELLFIVGMPRSGSTVLEQALSAHPDVLGCGLLNCIGAAERLLEVQGVLPLLASGPHSASASQLANARSFYLDQSPGNRADYRWVVDNNPLNFQRLPMILQLFPSARFIHLTRHPLDSVLACYFHHFQAGMNFAVNIETTSRYYAAHSRYMAHWHALYGESILPLSYEAMVGDFESTLSRLCQFLSLEPEDAMRTPHLNARSVLSASTWEVRQPVHQNHVGMWKNYRSHLQPVIDYFQALNILDDSLQPT